LKVPSLSKLNEGIKSSASMSADGRFLVLSFSAKYNGERTDLFISKKKSNERWSRPKKIKKANSNASEDAPFLSFDNKTLYFASDRKKKNTFDIYKMVRDSEAGRWSAPVLLGDTVNSAHWDSYFKTNATGRTAYFSSTRVTANGADLYTVDLAQPGSPNKNNSLVTVSGNIKDVLSSKTLIGQKFTVEVDGYPEDGITVSMDSASYRLRLPAGKQYILSASASGFGSIADTVDLSAATNLRRINNDLYLRPNPNVTIKGRMLVRSDESIPAKNVSGIIINGILCDSATIDLQQGTYEVNLKPGVAYSIKMVAEDLESVPAQLDLSGTENNREIILDLYALPKKVAQIAPVIKSVEAIKIVLVSGDIVNKKTGASLGQNSLIKINIEGSDIAPKIDPATGKYEARVPIGKNYTFSAAAPGFYPIYETIDVSQNDNSVSRTLYLVPVEVGQSIRLNNIFFEPGKAVLKKTSFPELNRVVSFLEDNADMKIEIAGHTDNVGQASTNQKLSLARAQAVATYLTAHGVNPSNIVTKGYGSVNPISSNETADGKARNRRVEFTILTR
jgi:outer membrane protein OmpA-like peptidoglycan-associated protein